MELPMHGLATLQHDTRSSAGVAADDGDLQQHHPLCAGLQRFQQDH